MTLLTVPKGVCCEIKEGSVVATLFIVSWTAKSNSDVNLAAFHGPSLIERDALKGLVAVAAGVLDRGARGLGSGVDQEVPAEVVLAGEEPCGDLILFRMLQEHHQPRNLILF